jgi:hypothetical protein
MSAARLPRPDWMATTDLLRELQKRHSSVEVRACVYILRGPQRTVFYDPTGKEIYLMNASTPLDPSWTPEANAERIVELVQCGPQKEGAK